MYDRTPGTIYEPAMTSAWVAPDGTWYHVEFTGHYATARVMGHDGAKLEDAGWVHLSAGYVMLRSGRIMTEAQESVLRHVADLYRAGAQAVSYDRHVAEYRESCVDQIIAACERQHSRRLDALEVTRSLAASLPPEAADMFYAAVRAAEATYTYRRDGD